MTAHARLSASAAHRWIPCPGSVALNASIPGRPSGAHAEEGTAAHAEAEACLRNGTDSANKDVQLYVDFCRAEMAKPGARHWLEMDLTPGFLWLHPDLGGTADFMRYDPATRDLLVADFKYGAGVFVGAERNAQLMMYAVGALAKMKPGEVQTVTVAVIQPRLETDEGPIRTWTCPIVELLDFAADMKKAADESKRTDAPLRPGDKQCRWCNAKVICPALQEQTTALVAQEFAVDVQPLDVSKIAIALDMIPMVEARIKAIRDAAYAEIAAGRTVPGYKLVQKRATRRWVDPEKVGAKLMVDVGPEAFEPPVLRSPAAVEKTLGKKAFAAYSEFCPAVSSGVTLAPAADPRPAVAQISAADFPALEDQSAA